MSNDPLVTETNISDDPIYYIAAGFFALLTTALPAVLGQPRFLPIIQTVGLVTFLSVSLHNRNVRGALNVMALWLPIQFVTVVLLTSTFLGQVEHAFTDGFAYRAAITSWFFGSAPHPASFTANPQGYLTEFALILLGSLATAGLAGAWFLMRLVNLAGYSTGILLTVLPNPGQALFVIPYWTLLRAAGYAGLIVLAAMPILTYQWSPRYYWHTHRRLLVIALALVVLGIAAEFILLGIVVRTPPD